MICQYPECENIFVASFELPARVTFPGIYTVDEVVSVYLCFTHAPEDAK